MKSFFTLILFFLLASLLFSQGSSKLYLNPYNVTPNIFVSNTLNSDSVYSEIPDEKSPWLALTLSYLFPGVGQFYNGEVLKGFLFWGGLSAGMGVAFLGVGDGEHESSNNKSFLYSGVAIMGAFWIWQLIDAPVSASRINKERRIRLKRTNIDIFPEVTQKGFGASVRISF